MNELTAISKPDYKSNLIDALMFFSMLFIGGDILGLEINDMNFRLAQLFLFFATLAIFINDRFRLYKNITIVGLIFFFLISTLLSISIKLSLPYFFWLLFNYLFIICLFYSYIMEYGILRLFKLLRATIYIQAIIIILQFILEFTFSYKIPFLVSATTEGIPRPAVWFLEPSYFAIYFSFWVMLSAYLFLIANIKSFGCDLFVTIIAIIASTSTTGFVAIGISAIFVFLLALVKKKRKSAILILGIVSLSAIAMAIILPEIYESYFLRLFNSDLSSSSGGRTDKFGEAFSIFSYSLKTILLGIGPNAYAYFLNQPIANVSNISLELLSTTGLITTMLFYLMFCDILRNGFLFSRYGDNVENKYTMATICGFIVFIIVMQVTQNYLRLYIWMLLSIIVGEYKIIKTINYTEHERQ